MKDKYTGKSVKVVCVLDFASAFITLLCSVIITYSNLPEAIRHESVLYSGMSTFINILVGLSAVWLFTGPVELMDKYDSLWAVSFLNWRAFITLFAGPILNNILLYTILNKVNMVEIWCTVVMIVLLSIGFIRNGLMKRGVLSFVKRAKGKVANEGSGANEP